MPIDVQDVGLRHVGRCTRQEHLWCMHCRDTTDAARVARLMREEGIRGRVRRRFKTTTMSDHADPIAPNVLDRDFTAAGPNQRWVGDTSEFLIGEHGKLYLAAILDLYSRFVVGWAISAVNDRRLTLKALEMAVQRRCPAPGLLHHSDRGCTYTCEDYQTYLASHGITCSMSRRADCRAIARHAARSTCEPAERAERHTIPPTRTLTPADVARMEEAFPASAVDGTRYDEHQMRILDSER